MLFFSQVEDEYRIVTTRQLLLIVIVAVHCFSIPNQSLRWESFDETQHSVANIAFCRVRQVKTMSYIYMSIENYFLHLGRRTKIRGIECSF